MGSSYTSHIYSFYASFQWNVIQQSLFLLHTKKINIPAVFLLWSIWDTTIHLLTLQTNNSPHCTLFIFVFWTISDLFIGQLLFCSTICSSLFPQLLKNTFFLLLFSIVFSAYGPPSLPSKHLLFHILPIPHLLSPFSQLNRDSTNSWRMTRSLKKHNIFRS